MVGIHGAAKIISPSYRSWAAAHPDAATRNSGPAANMVSFASPLSRAALDHGEFGAWLDKTMRAQHLISFATEPDDDPDIAASTPLADEWAAHVAHVIRTVRPDHVGIGLDLAAAHSPSVMHNASGYPDLIAALRRVTDADTVFKVASENWLRVLDAVLD